MLFKKDTSWMEDLKNVTHQPIPYVMMINQIHNNRAKDQNMHKVNFNRTTLDQDILKVNYNMALDQCLKLSNCHLFSMMTCIYNCFTKGFQMRGPLWQ